MNKELFINEVMSLNVNIDDIILEKLNKYYLLLKEYNEHTNLTRIIEEEDVYLKHFYDSLTITKVIDLDKVNNLLDIGSGAGFPGILLKIFYPNLNVTCIDSNNKKTKFLTYISNALDLEVNIINDRAEKLYKKHINKYDIVTARAVANLRVLIEISVPFVKKDGYFIAMKGNTSEELIESKFTIEKLNINLIQKETFLLPIEKSERTILKLQKVDDTNIKNIRPYDKVLKKPLK